MRSARKNWNGSSMNVTVSYPARGGWLMLLILRRITCPRILSAPLQQWNPYNRGTALDAPQR